MDDLFRIRNMQVKALATFKHNLNIHRLSDYVKGVLRLKIGGLKLLHQLNIQATKTWDWAGTLELICPPVNNEQKKKFRQTWRHSFLSFCEGDWGER